MLGKSCGVEWKGAGSVDFALTEASWQVQFGRALSCRGNMGEAARF